MYNFYSNIKRSKQRNYSNNVALCVALKYTDISKQILFVSTSWSRLIPTKHFSF